MKRNILFLLCFILLAAFTWSGCDSSSKPNHSTPPAQEPQTEEVTLYFVNSSAEGLVAEERTLEVKNEEELPAALVEALIAGPDSKDLFPTLPPETRLLSVDVKDKVAAVDFSEELISKHWGGSTGETMTIMSVVNTLTELDSIEKVQFLVEGEVMESLLGHWDTSTPIERDEKIIIK